MRVRTGLGRRTLQVIVGIFIVVWSMLPIYWAFVVSVSRPADLRIRPVSLIPRSFGLDNFGSLLVPVCGDRRGLSARLCEFNDPCDRDYPSDAALSRCLQATHSPGFGSAVPHPYSPSSRQPLRYPSISC